MRQNSSSRWIAIVAAGVGALVLMVGALFLLSQQANPAPSPLPTQPTGPSPEPPVAIVDGEEIPYDAWQEAVLVDQVMSHLAGTNPPTPRQTLERLINELLIMRATDPVPAPVEGEVEGYLTALKAGWGVDDVVVSAALAEAGLDRAALVRTVAWLLEVERRQEALEADVESISMWLSQRRADADITIYEERLTIDGLDELARSLAALIELAPSQTPTPSALLAFPSPPASSIPTPAFSPPATPAVASWPPVLPREAIDFTLERALGGDFTLSEQLAEGPVVLVFFQKCG